MNSLNSLTKVLATATLIVLGSSLSFAATETRTLVPELGTAEVSQALERLNAENDKRVNAAINDSMAAMAAQADDTVVAINRPIERHAGPRFARDFRRLHRIRG